MRKGPRRLNGRGIPSLASFGQPRARQREARWSALKPSEHPAILPHDRPRAVPNGPLHFRNRVWPTGRPALRMTPKTRVFGTRHARMRNLRSVLAPFQHRDTGPSDAPMRDRRAPCEGPPVNSSTTQTELVDQRQIARVVLALEVIKQAAALRDESKQTTAGKVILLVVLEVLRQVLDALGKGC